MELTHTLPRSQDPTAGSYYLISLLLKGLNEIPNSPLGFIDSMKIASSIFKTYGATEFPLSLSTDFSNICTSQHIHYTCCSIFCGCSSTYTEFLTLQLISCFTSTDLYKKQEVMLVQTRRLCLHRKICSFSIQ